MRLFAGIAPRDYNSCMGITRDNEKTHEWTEIDEGIFRIAHPTAQGLMGYSPHLVIDGTEGVLIDPGAAIHARAIFDAVSGLIRPDRVRLMVAHHQDPDICSAIPELARLGIVSPVAMHWRTETLVPYYGIENPFFIVNENRWEWKFESGRTLRFIAAPYCHFAGCIMTWDERSGILFSGDLFGAIDGPPGEFAGADYHEPMRAFHEHYMPSHEILKPVMDSILRLPVRQIAPQHGKVIRDNVRDFILELRELQCGAYLGVRPPPTERQGDRPGTSDGDAEGGLSREKNTGLLNGASYRKRLAEILAAKIPPKEGAEPFALVYFLVDNLEEINQIHGRVAGDDAIRGLAYLVRNAVTDRRWECYKVDAPYVAAIATGATRTEVRAIAERARYDAAEATFAAERITVSAGILYGTDVADGEMTADDVDKLALARLFRARKASAGSICDFVPGKESGFYLKKRILLIDPDESWVRFIAPFFRERGYYLMTAPDGADVSFESAEDNPDIVVAAAMTPRLSGFELREKMLNSVKGKNIPFILVSRRKDEEFIRKAADLGILFYLKKPFSKTELLGLIDNILGQS